MRQPLQQPVVAVAVAAVVVVIVLVVELVVPGSFEAADWHRQPGLRLSSATAAEDWPGIQMALDADWMILPVVAAAVLLNQTVAAVVGRNSSSSESLEQRVRPGAQVHMRLHSDSVSC